ncbi:hypothetical protein D1007_13981 [Hordeum vulgare]|nr:hypothetical protein D1007_13981 [Hordeum vulgare]
MVDGRWWVAWSCMVCRGRARVVVMTTTTAATTATTAAIARSPMVTNSNTMASCRSTDFLSNEANKSRGDSVQVHPCHLTFSPSRCSVGRMRADNVLKVNESTILFH